MQITAKKENVGNPIDEREQTIGKKELEATPVDYIQDIIQRYKSISSLKQMCQNEIEIKKYIDHQFKPFNNKNRLNQLIKFRRLQYLFPNQVFIFENDKIIEQSLMSNIYLQLIMKGAKEIPFKIKNYDVGRGRMQVEFNKLNYFLDDFVPVRFIDGDLQCQLHIKNFEFPFIQPSYQNGQINIYFTILEKLLAKLYGSYEVLRNKQFKTLAEFIYQSHLSNSLERAIGADPQIIYQNKNHCYVFQSKD